MARIRLRGVIAGSSGDIFGKSYLWVEDGCRRDTTYALECRLVVDGGGTVCIDLGSAHIVPATTRSQRWSEIAPDPLGRPFVAVPDDTPVRLTANTVFAGEQVAVLGEVIEEGFLDGSGGPRSAPMRGATTVRAIAIARGPDADALLDEVSRVVLESNRWLYGDRWPSRWAAVFALVGVAIGGLTLATRGPLGRAGVALACLEVAAFFAVMAAARCVTGTYGSWWGELPRAIRVLAWPIVLIPGIVAPFAAAALLASETEWLARSFLGWAAAAGGFGALMAVRGTRPIARCFGRLLSAPVLAPPFTAGAWGAASGTVAERNAPTYIVGPQPDLVSDCQFAIETQHGPLFVNRPFEWASTEWRWRARGRNESHVMSVPVGGHALVAGTLSRDGAVWELVWNRDQPLCLYATGPGGDARRVLGRRLAALQAARAATAVLALAIAAAAVLAITQVR